MAKARRRPRRNRRKGATLRQIANYAKLRAKPQGKVVWRGLWCTLFQRLTGKFCMESDRMHEHIRVEVVEVGKGGGG